jgi:hypothetical protein
LNINSKKQTHDMKKIISIIAITIGLSLPLILTAQTPPHPNGGFGPGSGNTPVGEGPAGAPVGSGTLILTLLAASYAGIKSCKKHDEEQ